jgi:hypothetical protein
MQLPTAGYFPVNRDEVDADDEPTIILKTGYDIYRLLAFRYFIIFSMSKQTLVLIRQ